MSYPTIAAKSHPQFVESIGADRLAGPATEAERPRRAWGKWVALATLCLGALVMYGALWPQAPLRNTDTTGYLMPLRDFLAHGHLTEVPGRTPGLPLFLLITGTGRSYFYAGLLLYLLGLGGLVHLLFRLRVRPWLVWSFAFLVLLPPFAQNVAYIASEGLTETLL